MVYSFALSSMLGMDCFAQATVVPEKDAAEIHAVAEDAGRVNRHDRKAFARCMSDDVEWVNVVGMW